MSEVSSTTGSTGSGGGSSIRITGLNSGLDVDALVKKMLNADQTKIDMIKQQQQIITWKQEAYKDIISDIKELQEKYFNVSNTSTYLLSSSNYNNIAATSSDSTIVTAKASTSAKTGTYKMEVSKIAESAAISSSNSVNSQYRISDVSNWKSGTMSFSVDGGSSVSLDLTGFDDSGSSTDTEKAQSLAKYINNQINSSGLNGEVSVSAVTDSSGTYIKFTPADGSSVKMTTSGITDIGDGTKTLVSASSTTALTDLSSDFDLNKNLILNLNYNGKDVSVTLDNSSTGKNGSATVDDLITAIETATGGAVTGNFDDMTGKFTFQTKATGSTASLAIKETYTDDEGTSYTTDEDLLKALGMEDGNLYVSAQGSDAVVTITEPGSTSGTILTESSNTFTVNGVTYTVTSTTDEDKPVNISLTKDTSQMHDLITDFLDDYNKIVDNIQTKLSEKKDYDYSPLTDSQKEDMSDSDIANWDKKAKQGILRNDDNLQNLLTSLRSAFTSPVLDSNGNSVSSVYFGSMGDNTLGIDTSNDYTQGSKITIEDDTKLIDALTNNADEIMKLFTTKSTSTDSTEKFNQSGIFQRMDQIIKDNVGVIGSSYNTATLTKYANVQDDYSVTGGSGSGTLPDQIYQKQLLIDKLTDLMDDHEEKYYKQFSALETALESLSAQQSIISSYFSS
ncbi:flagellar filament capping protein FliD [Clostridium sp.]|uniref:flagellar filament capping protein FliD n=1 Tax=Clostridium sp. TaxID=1506 RepID=UPI002FDD850F